MGCCADIKFHGYFIGVLAGLLELISLSISGYTQLVDDDPNHSELPKDLLELVSCSAVDYVGDVLILIAVGMLIYGIHKENRYFIIPFTIAICFDWVSYLAHNIDRGMPFHVWMLTTAFFVYVFVAMLSLFILFGTKIKTTKAEKFVKFHSQLV
ncbi:uncharacterized protein LOC131693685 [Topomyia yanbarensis]|uniref:uncharacterized protein LOC131693685 n=1 Tax=Topomyia yanbarensis TaxID=2498891 RepID=UPI00273C536D|nr:uncharacterized protein LOC131693685 [Topomyia yanbarensis]